MSTIPIAEMQADLKATRADIERLGSIVANMGQFIADSGGENRSGFRVDLMRWQVLLDQAIRLRQHIVGEIERANAVEVKP